MTVHPQWAINGKQSLALVLATYNIVYTLII